MRKMVIMLAKMQMPFNLQLKICTAVCIFQWLFAANSPCQAEAKARAERCHDINKSLPKAGRASQPPPFLLVVEEAVDITEVIALAKYDADTPVRAASISFCMFVGRPRHVHENARETLPMPNAQFLTDAKCHNQLIQFVLRSH